MKNYIGEKDDLKTALDKKTKTSKTWMWVSVAAGAALIAAVIWLIVGSGE